MMVVGVVGYVQTVRGLRSLHTVWAQKPNESVKRRFYKNWYCSKQKAFSRCAPSATRTGVRTCCQSCVSQLSLYNIDYDPASLPPRSRLRAVRGGSVLLREGRNEHAVPASKQDGIVGPVPGVAQLSVIYKHHSARGFVCHLQAPLCT